MSNLILQGDTIDNFGEFLPAPYIEQIEIYETSFTVSLAMFLTIMEGEDVANVISRLKADLNIYFFIAFNQGNEIVPVLKSEVNIFDYYENYDYSTNTTLLLDVTGDIFPTDPTAYDPTPYLVDNNGNSVIKLQLTRTTTFRAIEEGVGMQGVASAWEDFDDFRIFAFSSAFDYASDVGNLGARLSNPVLFERQLSDLSTEKIVADGRLHLAQAIRYFDKNKEIYNPQPLKSLSGQYYKTKGGGKTNNQKIIDYFNDLLSDYKSKDGPALKKIMSNVSYILETYEQEPDLLVQLNMLRRVFPSKSLSTEVGRFYQRYAKRISTMNKAIQNSPEVFKKIIRNPKILDLRDPELPTWSEPGYADIDTLSMNKYIYKGPDATGRQLVGTGTEPLVRNFGYIFFDYEKALKNVAAINHVIDVEKLEKYGIPLDYSKFRVTSVELIRTFDSGAPSNNASIKCEMYSNYYWPEYTHTIVTDNSGMVPDTFIVPAPTEYPYGAVGYDVDTGQQFDMEIKHGILDVTTYCYLMPRNFQPVNGESKWDPNYRLMCFEYQDFSVEDQATRYSETYEVIVTIEDSSIGDLVALKAETVIAKNSYNENFIDLAEADTPLAYDLTTGLFNEYFSDGITAIYEDDAPNAPWHRAPLLYHILSDLFYDTFDGDIDKIIEETLIVINSINPTNGNYYAAKKFADELDEFWDHAFSSTGDALTSTINGIDNIGTQTITFEEEITITTEILNG